MKISFEGTLIDLLFSELANHSANRSVIGASGGTGGVALLDSVERDIRAHIREIEGKILTIVDNLVGGQISSWDARPPVPSQSFRNISRCILILINSFHSYEISLN